MAPGRAKSSGDRYVKRARSIAQRKAKSRNDDTPDVYRGLLQETSASPASQPLLESDRPLKRRRIAAEQQSVPSPATLARLRPNIPMSIATDTADTSGNDVVTRPLQTVLDYSDDSDGSDVEWEDVELSTHDHSDVAEQEKEPEVKDLSIVLGDDEAAPRPKRPKRKGITAAERKMRLDVHKMHVLCLLYHVYVRNAWCNDRKAQETLKAIVPPKIVTSLLPDPHWPQLRMSQSFRDGLNTLKMFWSSTFRVDAHGMCRPRWNTSGQDIRPSFATENRDPPMERLLFREAAFKLNGSQDIGAQLLCTLLRSIGVEVRLVCSLQCFSFNAAEPSTATTSPQNGKKTLYLEPVTNIVKTEEQINTSREEPQSSNSLPAPVKRIGRIGRLGNETGAIDKGKAPRITAIPEVRPLVKPQYPVFWVEAFNAAHQKWIPVDPLATFTMDKPTKLEPPLQSLTNVMTYVLAFEEDGTVRDVTRRYAKAYNAKTRKSRVESTEGGSRWLEQALKPFKRLKSLDRDQLEDAALSRQEATEGMPKNIQDFKDHPVYVLERHLRRNEVLYPKNEVGKVNVGSSMSKKMESVYRRTNVHVVRSADKWYRLGREVIPGEQPLKHAMPRIKRSLPKEDGSDNEAQPEIGLYAAYQTNIYVPPPVVRGRIPKNAFGNLDVYTPTMIPPGGVHIQHADASKAARIMGIDFADAVTGFSFKGRVGTAVVQGCIVAAEYAEAVAAVIDGMAYVQEEAEVSRRVTQALRMWRRFHLGLKIVERVQAYASDEEHVDVQVQIDATELQDAALEAQEARDAERFAGGGFFPGEAADNEIALPTGQRDRTIVVSDNEDIGGEGSSRTSDRNAGADVACSQGEDGGGGFVPGDDDGYERGGFLPDANSDDANRSGFIPEDTDRAPAPKEVSRSFGDSTTSRVYNPNSRLQSHLFSEDSRDLAVDDDLAGGFTVAAPTQSMHAPPPMEADEVITNESLMHHAHTEEDTMMSGALGTSSHQIGPAVVADEGSNTDELEPGSYSEQSLHIAEHDPRDAASRVRDGAGNDVPTASSAERRASDSDHDSLLSHDPDDEDAEPEWLY